MKPARTAARNTSGAWPMKTHRQSILSMIRPPATTPMTGDPAPTNDHQPRATARSRGANRRLMNARADGPMAAPPTAASRRNTTKEPADHDAAIRIVKNALTTSPKRKTERWPRWSPSLPNVGPRTALTRIGPVTAQTMVDCAAPNSSAIFGTATAMAVTLRFTMNMAVSTTVRAMEAKLSRACARFATRRLVSSSPQGRIGTGKFPDPNRVSELKRSSSVPSRSSARREWVAASHVASR